MSAPANERPVTAPTPVISPVTARRKILVEAMTMCLERSKVREVVDGATIRSVLSSAINEMWRGGELNVEVLWKILRQQPELSEEEAALPLLTLSTYQQRLGLRIKLPDSLAEVPQEQCLLLRDGVGLTEASLDKAVEQLRALEVEEDSRRESARLVDQASAAPITGPKPKLPSRRGTSALVGIVVAIVGLAVSGFSLYFFVLRDTGNVVELSHVSDVVPLTEGRRAQGSLAARIADPTWETLSKDEKQKRARKLFERLSTMSLQIITLTDESGRTRVVITALGGEPDVQIF